MSVDNVEHCAVGEPQISMDELGEAPKWPRGENKINWKPCAQSLKVDTVSI